MAYQEGDFPHNVFGNCKDSLRKVVLGESWHCFADLRSLEDGRQNESSLVKSKNPIKFIGILVLISVGAKSYPLRLSHLQ